MTVIDTTYTVRGFRSGESDPRADLILSLASGHDAASVDPDLVAEVIRDHVASLPGIISVQVRKLTTDVTNTALLPL
jgi:hypothetical protein